MTTMAEAPSQKVASKTRHLRVKSTLTLAAVPTAVACSRMFVKATLCEWKLSQLTDDATLLMSELMTNAVRSTGIVDPSPSWPDLEGLALVQANLVLLQDGLIIEVGDRDKNPPVQKDFDDDSEGGRGLFLVEAMSKQWSFYFPPTGGKVVWCELSLPPFTSRGLPRRTRVPGPSKPVEVMNDPVVLQQVLEGLRKRL